MVPPDEKYAGKCDGGDWLNGEESLIFAQSPPVTDAIA